MSGGMCVGVMYKFLSTLLRLIQHITLYCISTYPLGTSVPDVLPSTPGVMPVCVMLYTFYPGCDGRMGAACTLVSSHIWLCRVWYVCHLYVICFSQLYVSTGIVNKYQNLLMTWHSQQNIKICWWHKTLSQLKTPWLGSRIARGPQQASWLGKHLAD